MRNRCVFSYNVSHCLFVNDVVKELSHILAELPHRHVALETLLDPGREKLGEISFESAVDNHNSSIVILVTVGTTHSLD